MLASKNLINYSNTSKRSVKELYLHLEKIIKKLKSGELKKALNDAIKLQKLFPNSSDLLNIIGAIYFKQKNNSTAIKYYKKALNINPNTFETVYNLGAALKASYKYQESLKFFKRSAEMNPRSWRAHQEIGRCYKNLKNSSNALSFYNRALSIQPDQVSILNDLGILHGQIGQNEKAKEYFRRILEIRPNWGKAHRHLSLVIDYKHDKEHILDLEELISKKLNPIDEIQIRYAYFRATSAIGQVDVAFENLAKSKNLRKAHSNYNIQNELKVFTNVKKFYKKTHNINVVTQTETARVKTIFIVGMPRSGTTLVEQILDSHSKVFSGGEVPFLGNKLYPKFLSEKSQLNFSLNSELNFLYKDYEEFINRLIVNPKYFVDKMPTNFLWIGQINKLFPDTKIINVRRDPMAVIWSNYKHYFSSKELNFGNSLDDIISYYEAYESLMNFWKIYLDQKIYELSYENLTVKPKIEINKLLKFCGLDWEDSCISFYKQNNLVQTASRSQVRKPIYTGSSDEWKKYHKHLAFIEEKVRSSLGAKE